jgi:phosphoribosylglycinamide formyltransferase-1
LNGSPLAVVVLISGRGSNLQSVIDSAARGELDIALRAVISNRPNAGGLERARRAGIPALVVDHCAFPDRRSFDRALAVAIDAYRPQLVVLAGFMRVLSDVFVRHYAGRMINIHPSLLPAYRGLDTHQRVLAAGEQEHGASVHFVTPELDGGPVIAQARVPVHAGDDPETLASRVLEQEHQLLPQVLGWIAQGRLHLEGERLLFEGEALKVPLQLSKRGFLEPIDALLGQN